MEDAGAHQEPIRESTQKSGTTSPSDAEAFRTVILVVGFVLLIPGLIALVLYLVWMVMGADSGTDDYLTYLWVTYLIGAVSMVGAVIAGFLLVRIARKRIVYSVGEMLYPAAVVVGAYMVLLAAARFLIPIVSHYVLVVDFVGHVNWSIVYWSAITPGLLQLPYFVGGLLLIIIGKHRYPPRRPSEGSLYGA